MMSISELKKSARNSLKGYWGTVAISYLIYFLISFVTGCIPIINFISTIVIIPAIAIGLNSQAFNLCLGNEISVKDMFVDSKKMIKSILFNLLLSICLILLVICLAVICAIATSIDGILLLIVCFIAIVAFIHLGIRLSLSYFVIIDNEDMGVMDIFKECFRISKNNCIKILLADLSFIPLLILGGLGLTIPFLWIIPYMLTTKAHLYLDIKEQSNNM